VKKLQRLKEQAKEDNLDFNQLVMNHFGNLEVKLLSQQIIIQK